MYICSNCFNDIELRSHINSLASGKGDCSFCGSKDVLVLLIDELLDFFNELFNLYQSDETGTELFQLINSEWNLFANDLASLIISNVLPGTKFSDWEALTKVSYIDEIKENISYWDKLKESIKWDRRFFIKNEDLKDLEWDVFLADHISFDEKEQYFRARIHHKEGEATFPLMKMGSQEKSKVNTGRANPQGIPYLYLSRSKETTLYETRALYRDEVSIGEFKIKDGEKLTLVDFTEKGSAFLGS